ncbi:efflux RND transporter periplasmic adaptor subunit [Candidatus Nitrosacidococcus sp. I8]|uniref:efflux RND transporter periplasmic adaptor subunit n=1 Tax=Candidatus Nitrosacidococcus sp. I8 TaxID=2942908 RepID=UPI00222788D3|nr:efflux RND transporter periplasmic adaptor subunit [Candidatus Nitrosacidococcus sp. I8]CAH9017986.1 Multidrug resistance protein MdtA [Candidatus Nitrosacidococcus sp. I8]
MEELEKLKIARHRDKDNKSKIKYKWLVIFSFLFVSISSFFYIQFFHKGIKVKISTISQVYPAQNYTLFNATGYVVPQTKADIASKGTGQLEVLNVEEGDHIKKGDIIAQLENQDVLAAQAQAKANIAVAKAGLLEAQAELENAQIELTRLVGLAKRKLATQSAYDAAEARYNTAKAAIQSAEATITATKAAYQAAKVAVEYTLIRAPFDGVILEKHADVGDVIVPLSPATQSKGAVVSMADMSTLQIEADVSEANLMQVEIHQPCQIQFDAFPDKRIRGRVHMIVPTVDRSKATVLVKISFIDQDKRILPDMSARVSFLSQALSPEDLTPRTVIPKTAIVTKNNQNYAFQIQDNIAHLTTLILGEAWGDSVVLKQGLNLDDEVVINPPETLKDNARILPITD